MSTTNASTDSSLVLKIQLKNGDAVEHYRKRTDPATITFARLHALIESLLPGRSISAITYLDGDLDEIRINDDEDLKEALMVKNEKSTETLRLSVHSKPSVPGRKSSAGVERQQAFR